jgi:hypothetical protein
MILYIEVECCFRLNPCFKAGIKSEIVFILPYCSAYLQTLSSPEEHALVVIGIVDTLTGSDNDGAK